MKINIVISCLFSLVFVVNGFAQQQFSGNWKTKTLTHISGPKYGNAIQSSMQVSVSSDSIIIETVTPGGGGKTTTGRQVYSLDGKAFTSTSATSKRKYIKTYALSVDKNTMTLTTVFYVPEKDNEIDFTRVETWTIENGQLILNKKSIETRSETWEVKAVFEKA